MVYFLVVHPAPNPDGELLEGRAPSSSLLSPSPQPVLEPILGLSKLLVNDHRPPEAAEARLGSPVRLSMSPAVCSFSEAMGGSQWEDRC